MRLVTIGVTEERWRGAVSGLPGYSLVQSWAYGEAKAALGAAVERGLIYDGERVRGGVQAVVRRLPYFRGGLAWINRGPLLDDASEKSFSNALALARRHWVLERGCYLRIAPPALELPSGHDESGREGFSAADAKGWASARLDLTLPLEALKAGLRKNWRNALSRAQREGPTVDSGSSEALFEEFLSAYGAFLKERGFHTTVTPDLLRALQRALPAREKMTVFVCRDGGRLAGAVLIATYGATCEYLAGFSISGAEVPGIGQLLLWSAIGAMKEGGARTFDLGGMDPDRTEPGILKFKEGLGAAPYRLPSEIEADDGRWPSRWVRWGVRLKRN